MCRGTGCQDSRSGSNVFAGFSLYGEHRIIAHLLRHSQKLSSDKARNETSRYALYFDINVIPVVDFLLSLESERNTSCFKVPCIHIFKLTKADSFEQYRGHMPLALLWKSGNTGKVEVAGQPYSACTDCRFWR